MSVVIKDDELELFKQNGVSQDQIANTVNTYRQQGLSDDDIRAKVDVKLNNYRQSTQPQQISEPQQDLSPVNNTANTNISTSRTANLDGNGNIYYTDENGNRIKGDPWYKQPRYWLKGATARAKNVLQGKGTPEENVDYALNTALIAGSLGAATPAVMGKQALFSGIKSLGRNQIAKLANNPATRNITRNALKATKDFAKSGIGKFSKSMADLGKEGALYGAAHHGINNVYGVENENSLPMDMAKDAGAFMAFGAGAKALGAGGKFTANKLSEKGGLLRNSKANLLKFKRSHPVASRRVDNVLSQINEAIAPGIERVGDTYYKGINKLNKLRDKAFAYADDMLSNDQIAFAKKHGYINAATEQGVAKEELRRINELKNTHNVNVDFDSIERSTYQRALNELTDKGLKESEARSILADRGMLDPELTSKNLDNVHMLNEKLGIKPQEETFDNWTQEQYDAFINSQVNSGIPKEAADQFLIDSGVQVEGKPISIETLNKVEQAIEEGKPITRESIYGEAGNKVLDDRYVKAVEEGVAPDELPEMVNRDLPDTVNVEPNTPISETLPQDITNVPKEQPIQNNQIVQEQDDPFKLLDEIQNANKQSEPVGHDLSMDKSKIGINTPKEDLTHVNEPSTSSNGIKPKVSKIKELQNQYQPEEEYNSYKVTKLEPGRAEGSGTSYKDLDMVTSETKKIKESDALDSGLSIDDTPLTSKFESTDGAFNDWYSRYEKAGENKRRAMLDMKFKNFKTQEEAQSFYENFVNQADRDINFTRRNVNRGIAEPESNDYFTSITEKDVENVFSRLSRTNKLPKAQKLGKVKEKETITNNAQDFGREVLKAMGNVRTKGLEGVIKNNPEQLSAYYLENIKGEKGNVVDKAHKKIQLEYENLFSKSDSEKWVKSIYEQKLNQIENSGASDEAKALVKDALSKAYNSKIKRIAPNKIIQKKTEAELFKEDLDNRLKTSINEVVSADKPRPPIYVKMLKIKNDLKRGKVEYNSAKAYNSLKNGTYSSKPVITTIRDLAKHDAKIAKDFEGLEDVIIEVKPKENGIGGIYNDANNTIWAANEDSLYHEMQHYLQHNFSSLTKEQLKEATRITQLATKHIHRYENFVNSKLKKYDVLISKAEKAGDMDYAYKLKGEKSNFYNRAIAHYGKWRNAYENSPLEVDAFYAGRNLTLIRKNGIVDMQKGYNYAKEGKISDSRLLNIEKETRNNFIRDKQINRRMQKQWRLSSSELQLLHDAKRALSERPTRYSGQLGSRGLNDRGVIETLNHINDGEVAERVVKQLRENTLKRTGLLEAEQAAKAIEIQEGKGTVWIQSNVPSKTVKTTNTLGEDVNASKNSKAGAFGHRESGEIKYTRREDRLRDDFTTAIRADSAHELASYAMKEYGIPLDKKVQGEYVPVNKKLLTQAIFLKNSKEWYQTIQEGDKAIEKVFKDKKVADYYKRLHKTVQQPDCKIPKDVFDMLFDGSGENAATYIDRYWDMSFDHSTNLGNKARGVGRLMGGLIDGWNAGWKRNKLATLSFVINNRLGNQMLLAAQGGKDYLTSLIDAAKTKDVDIPNEILSANIGEAFTDFLKKSPGQRINYTGYGVDKLFNLVNGTDLKIINTKPIKKLKLKDKPVLTKNTYDITTGSKVPVNNSRHKDGQRIGSLYRNGHDKPFPMYSKKLPKGAKAIRLKNPNDNTKTHFNNTTSRLLNLASLINNKWMAKTAQIINKVNDNFERFERKQAFSIVKKQYNREKLKNFIGRSELYKTMAMDINKCPEAKETILRGIEDMLGNYRTFSKFERNFLKRIKPFYSWDRTIIRTTLALTKKNPARAAWILYETKRLQNIQDDRKEYQQGSIDLPIKDERNKKQLLVNKREYGVPWSSLPRMDKKRWHEGFSSLFTAPYEAAIGHKLFLDKEFNDRRYFAVQTKDDKGKKHTQYYDKRTGKMLDKLPLAPRLGYIGKQLFADQIAPWTVNNLIKGDNLLGLIKADKNGNRTEYDTPYDTSFGGFRHNEAVGTATMKSKKGFPYQKKLTRMSAQDTAPTTKVLQRLGLGIQTKTPLSDFDKSEIKEQKEAAWRKKHKNKKRK